LTPLEETLDAYAQLIKQGKVRAIGASNYSASRLLEALQVSRKHGLPSYQTLQPLYNLCDRAEYEETLESVCCENGLGVITYSSLAGGFLTGKYRSQADLSKSPRGAGVEKYLGEHCLVMLHVLDDIARLHRCAPAAIALAWLIARPSVTAPLASATSVDQLKELLPAMTLQLDRSSLELLNHASASIAPATACIAPKGVGT